MFYIQQEVSSEVSDQVKRSTTGLQHTQEIQENSGNFQVEENLWET